MNEKELEATLTLLDQAQSACTSCGLCSEGCATFQATGWEQESPRGRLYLAHQFLHGNIDPKSTALNTFDRCLGCHACEFLCPHSVSYHQTHQLVQELRRDLITVSDNHQKYQQDPQWLTLAYRLSHRWWRHYGAKWLKIPFIKTIKAKSFAKKRRRPQVGQSILAVCCIQDLLQHDVIEKAIGFMQRLGESVEVDRHQPCCGAIFERLIYGRTAVISSKEQKKAVSMQKKSRESFLKWKTNQTYFLSRICQSSVISQEGALDIYAWIEKLLTQKDLILSFLRPKVVYYQPYCRHPKGQKDSIWRLLHNIQGLTLREVPYFQACCGAYCGENFLDPQHAQTLIQPKLWQLPKDATLIVTSPDCWSQFKSYFSNVYYPIEILAETEIAKKEKACE